MSSHSIVSAKPDQAARARQFQQLHDSGECFYLANPWDAGSARLFEKSGFLALGTSSGASAASLGKRDGELTRDEVLSHIAALAVATNLPLSADLEHGFGDTPDAVADTLRQVAAAGAVGASVEDFSGNRGAPILSLDHAVARVAAAVAAARSLPFPFMLTARAENFLHQRPDLADTITRLQAYERAGADVLFAPALPDLVSVRTVCAALTKPVSFMTGMPGKSFSHAELAACGVRRISFGGSFYRVALNAVKAAAAQIREHGTFDSLH